MFKLSCLFFILMFVAPIIYGKNIVVDIPITAFSYRSSIIQNSREVYWESPERAMAIYQQLSFDKNYLFKILSEEDFNQNESEFISILQKVHDLRYLDFLKNVYNHWIREESLNDNRGFIPENFAVGATSRFGVVRPPKNLPAAAGFYAIDRFTPIMAESYKSALYSAFSAYHGAKRLSESDEQVRYVLSRPPGHHAGKSNYGGYCFLNNTAVAAEYLVEKSPNKKVVILDIDLHHGNGTQDIFYDRDDVFYISLHIDPETGGEPYFTGYSDEMGIGKGVGFNRNFPLSPLITGGEYLDTLQKAILGLKNYSYDYLIISFGADTYADDPIGAFKLVKEDYFEIGRFLSQINKKTLIIQEGGYAVNDLGVVVKSFLDGFLSINL